MALELRPGREGGIVSHEYLREDTPGKGGRKPSHPRRRKRRTRRKRRSRRRKREMPYGWGW